MSALNQPGFESHAFLKPQPTEAADID